MDELTRSRREAADLLRQAGLPVEIPQPGPNTVRSGSMFYDNLSGLLRVLVVGVLAYAALDSATSELG